MSEYIMLIVWMFSASTSTAQLDFATLDLCERARGEVHYNSGSYIEELGTRPGERPPYTLSVFCLKRTR